MHIFNNIENKASSHKSHGTNKCTLISCELPINYEVVFDVSKTRIVAPWILSFTLKDLEWMQKKKKLFVNFRECARINRNYFNRWICWPCYLVLEAFPFKKYHRTLTAFHFRVPKWNSPQAHVKCELYCRQAFSSFASFEKPNQTNQNNVQCLSYSCWKEKGVEERPCDNNIDEIKLALDGFFCDSEMKLAISEINEL